MWVKDFFCAWCLYSVIFVKCTHVSVIVCGGVARLVVTGLLLLGLRRRLFLKPEVRCKSRLGRCILERVNCLCLYLVCVLYCVFDCWLNVVLSFPCL